MAQQAKNDFYKDADEMVMDFAAAVNEEAHALQAAGADVIQIDDPWLRNDPDAAKRIAVRALDRALAGLKVPTVVHLCFGYGAVVPKDKPVGYSFLPQLAGSTVDQISIEAAQPKLDLGILKDFSDKTIVLGVIELADETVETPQVVAGPHPCGAEIHRCEAAHSRAGLRDEISFARGGVRQVDGAERRRGHREKGTGVTDGL